MSLVNPTQMIRNALAQGCSVGAFNIDTMEMGWAVIDAAQDTSLPVIVQVTADTLRLWGGDRFAESVKWAATQASVPIALHLDHATDIVDIEQALQLGFTSVMYDGSMLPWEDNIRNTQRVVQLARAHGVMVEAEIGHVGRDGEPAAWEQLTSPTDVVAFFQATGVDVLAVAVGTRHGTRRRASDIRLDRLQEMRDCVDRPLVLHGSSGVPDDILKRVGRLGVGKVNIGSQLRQLWWGALEANRHEKPRVALQQAYRAVYGYVRQKLAILNRRDDPHNRPGSAPEKLR